MWMRCVALAPPTYSFSETPMRVIKHSSVSAPPVETARLGRSPVTAPTGSVPGAAGVVGKREGKRSVPSGIVLSMPQATEMLVCVRHLPICRTSCTEPPDFDAGAGEIVNAPVASVSAYAPTKPPV